MNPFDRLIDDLTSNRICLTHVNIAIKEYIRRDGKIPDEVKNIVAPNMEVGAGIVDICFSMIKKTVSEIELSYQRGYAAGYEKGVNNEQPKKGV